MYPVEQPQLAGLPPPAPPNTEAFTEYTPAGAVQDPPLDVTALDTNVTAGVKVPVVVDVVVATVYVTDDVMAVVAAVIPVLRVYDPTPPLPTLIVRVGGTELSVTAAPPAPVVPVRSIV
jgi:hypothetical protein